MTNIAGLQTFFASVKVTSGRYSLQTPPFFLRPKSGQIRSKLLCPATIPSVPQSGTQGQTGRKKRQTLLVHLFFRIFILFFASGKVNSGRCLLPKPPFFFTQNRGKFAPNCLALQLLHLLSKAAHKGKQGAKKANLLTTRLAMLFSVL